jgi:hypothetical protein
MVSKAWRLFLNKVVSNFAVQGFIATVVFGVMAYMVAVAANSYSRQQRDLARFTFCVDHEVGR